MEAQKRFNLSLVTAVLNLIAGVVYLLVKLVIPQIELTGGLSEPAKGFSGFMLLVFSCFALGLLVLNLITMAYLNREGKKVKGAVIGAIGHTFHFLQLVPFMAFHRSFYASLVPCYYLSLKSIKLKRHQL